MRGWGLGTRLNVSPRERVGSGDETNGWLTFFQDDFDSLGACNTTLI